MRFLFLIAVVFVSLSVLGQNRDYLIKTNGDTLKGSIQLIGKIFYVSNPVSVKTAVNADEVKKIKSVNYRGSTVVHCALQVYTDNLDELELDWIKREVTDTVMILEEIISTPKINLYFGQSNIKTHFYFYKIPSDPFPVQLVVRYFLQGGLDNYTNDRAKYRGDKSKVNIVEDKGYVNQLHAIMGDCDKIPETMWEILNYRDYSLKKLIKRYNSCN